MTARPAGKFAPVKALGLAVIAISLGGCAGGAGDIISSLIPSGDDSASSGTASAIAQAPVTSADGTAPAAPDLAAELQKATVYWGQQFAKEPSKLENAMNYAKNLRALGEKRQAMAVLQQASALHGANKDLAAEYGKLALELDQTQVAKQMLAIADDPAKPDWKIISARGTAEAKLGNYKNAIPLYERALALNPAASSVQNNLALALTMNGEAQKAEGLLRQASTADGANSKVKQNLALVLGLQGKYDEATKVGSETLNTDGAKSNTQLIRNMVKLEPKVMPGGVIAAPSAHINNVAGASPIPGLKPSTAPQTASAVKTEWAPKVAATAPAATPAAAANWAAPTVIQANGTSLKPAAN